MGLSKASKVIIAIALVLLVFAPVWRWAIAPAFIELPDDLDVSYSFTGTATYNVLPQSGDFRYLSGSILANVPLDVRQTLKNDTSLGTSKTASVSQKVSAAAPRGQENPAFANVYPSLSSDRYYSLERKTQKNVQGSGAVTRKPGYNPRRRDYFPLFPLGTVKDDYGLWDDEINALWTAAYKSDGTKDGNDKKDIILYYFEIDGKPTKMAVPPPGFPKTVTGQQLKVMLSGWPERPAGFDPAAVPAEAVIELKYLKQVTSRFGVVPRTGTIVDVTARKDRPGYRALYLLDTGQFGLTQHMPLLDVRFDQTPGSVKSVLDDASSYFARTDLLTLWIPLAVLVLGLILIMVGVFLGKGPGVDSSTEEEAAEEG